MATLLLAGIVFLAFLIEAALGFGSALVTVSLASFITPIDQLLPAYMPLALALSLYLAGRHHAGTDWKLLWRRMLPLMALGLPVGMALFQAVERRLLLGFFGLFVFVLSAIELARLRRPELSPPTRPRWERLLLLLGGVLHGAFATGGPMAVYVAGRILPDKGRFRSTLSALWVVLNAALVVGYAAEGVLTRASLRLSMVLAIPLVAGLVAGEWLHARAHPKHFRTAVFGLLLVVGGTWMFKAGA